MGIGNHANLNHIVFRACALKRFGAQACPSSVSENHYPEQT
jgi:hypothetical protein